MTTTSTSTNEALGRLDHVVIGFIADEGMPFRIAERLSEGLAPVLQKRLSGDVTWEVKHRAESLPLNEDGKIRIDDLAQKRQDWGWDIAILLTDLPRRSGTQPIVSDYSVGLGIAMLSMPAVGAWRVNHRSIDLVVHLLGHLLQDRLRLDADRLHSGRFGATQHIHSEDEQVDEHLALAGVRGRTRLLAGMVRDNRPWRLVPHLAGATAAALATAAYGVVTTNFWTLADALPAWRLALLNAAAIAAMVAWLLFYNHLWEKASRQSEREKAVLYNVSTLVTLTIGVACMYAILFIVTVVAAFAVIDGKYLSSQLGHPSSLGSYAIIAWLSCSVGIVAGALGSSFESEEGIRKATYGKRERERQEKSSGSGGSQESE